MQQRNEGKGNEVIRGRRIDFLGYQFTYESTLLRKRIKKNFVKNLKNARNKDKKKQILASYWGWCKWGNCKNLWKKITNNDMSFAERGIKSLTTTKDGKKFFDVPEKRMMEILNSPIEVVDFEKGVKTRNGDNRYAIRFNMMEHGEKKQFKVITNSFTLKSVLDQVRAYDERLKELNEMKDKAIEKFGPSFDLSRMNLSAEECDMLSQNTPMLPQSTCVHRRELGGGKYDFYFD